MGAAHYILVVDDDPAIASTLRDLLALEEYETSTAPHGEAALEACARREPDAILLDMRMPVMDGWEFARRYRLVSRNPAPIICMTAARDAAQWAAEIGAEAHVAKPFDVDTLLAAVQSALDRRRTRAA
jgi:two-component system, chemotaxis family, chemotaxis protein CheY